jgi:predicted nucleotidyltransferase
MDFRHPLEVVTPTLDGDVLVALARAEEMFTGRRLHRMVGHGSEPGIRRAADRLVEQGLVGRREVGRAKVYWLNREHLAAPYVEGLAFMRQELVGRLRDAVASWEPPPRFVFLFGSAARGEATPESDLDLLVIRSRDMDEDDSEWRDQLAQLERDATAWTGNEARILEYGEDELSDASVREVIEQAVAEGIELHGSRHELSAALRSDKR